MDPRRLEEVDEEALKELREGWCVGSEAFRKERTGSRELPLRPWGL